MHVVVKFNKEQREISFNVFFLQLKEKTYTYLLIHYPKKDT